MDYEKQKNGILIKSEKEFNPESILECGQIFRFGKNDAGEYFVHSEDKRAVIHKVEGGWFVETAFVDYFENFFDLKTDYLQIEKSFENDEILKTATAFGKGLRIINNSFVETVISFVISANNNIPRIKKIIERLCDGAGTDMGEFYAFPTLEQLNKKDLAFFESLGAGYRGKYLFKVSKQLLEIGAKDFDEISTDEALKKLLKLCGVGPKVADCILLFSLKRRDVFPVDTWIEKIYHKYYEGGLQNPVQIRKFLTGKFGELSGFAQQYLFYAERSLFREKLSVL